MFNFYQFFLNDRDFLAKKEFYVIWKGFILIRSIILNFIFVFILK